MIFHIDNILSDHEIAAIHDAVSDESLWRDGAETAKGRAKAVKSNLQADMSSAACKGVAAKIRHALESNPVFKSAAQPAEFARILLNRYGKGMSYGAHVDAPYIGGVRTDLSFTLFLSAPDTYDGGELVIDNVGHEDKIKGMAGSVILYPSSNLHQVKEVTSGDRLAVVGWVKSRVRSADHRALLFDLETAIADLDAIKAPVTTRDRLANLRNNLVRVFGD